MIPTLSPILLKLNDLHIYFNEAVLLGLFIAFAAFVGSLFINSPYGRFGSSAYGVELDPRLGWVLMELMATLSFIYFYFQGPRAFEQVPLFFASLYLIHYANRGFYFPLNIRVHKGTKSSFSILVVVCGFVVTSLHGYLNAQWYSRQATFLDWEWFCSPLCIIGLIIYEAGFWSTIRCEYIMRHLRDGPSNARYTIPHGFLFEHVTSPQYFTELVGFFGWAMMTRNPGGLVIFLISAANLVPRAVQSHQWYHAKFDNYPKERKILIPFVW
jgi:3-oxo-5-alpha-steroid 4-dehydrogenase 1